MFFKDFDSKFHLVTFKSAIFKSTFFFARTPPVTASGDLNLPFWEFYLIRLLIPCFHFVNPLLCSAGFYIETSQLMLTANQLNGFFIMGNTAKWSVSYVAYIHQNKYTYCLSEKVRFENLIWKKQKQPPRGVLENRSSEIYQSSDNMYEEVHIYRLITCNFTNNYFLHRYFSGILTANFM